jgi:hypothetical protein
MAVYFVRRKEEFNMFTTEQRDQVRHRVMELARADQRVTGGAFTGSMAFGSGDRWSDIDVAFGITDGSSLEAVLHDWTQVLDREFSVIDHFDLRSDSSIYRVFLLQNGLEVDVAVTPGEDFGARGPQFRVLFGSIKKLPDTPQPSASSFIGLGWHHILHARSSIERKKPWQAEYWISGIRDHTLDLACLRFGENAYYGRGVDNLPAVVTGPLSDALVRSLDEPELRRALAVATRCFISELDECDPGLCSLLSPLLQEISITQAS